MSTLRIVRAQEALLGGFRVHGRLLVVLLCIPAVM
jgi:hypothetical protein